MRRVRCSLPLVVGLAFAVDDQTCNAWAQEGECYSNAVFMWTTCEAACKSVPKDTHSECHNWANKDECEKNAVFMKSGCGRACARLADSRRDRDENCAKWAEKGECDSNAEFMRRTCWTSCERLLDDQLDEQQCTALAKAGRCREAKFLVSCRSTCRTALLANRSRDTEGNCWYWATDGECSNPLTQTQCSQSCGKLDACARERSSEACALPVQCPVARDRRQNCPERALRGECRAASRWQASALLDECALSCHLLDPSSVSNTVTRPAPLVSALVFPPALLTPSRRHAATRCEYVRPRTSGLPLSPLLPTSYFLLTRG